MMKSVANQERKFMKDGSLLIDGRFFTSCKVDASTSRTGRVISVSLNIDFTLRAVIVA